jgi:hypothetical protein
MVAPCYFLACRIFEDAGLRTRAVGEGAEWVYLEALEKGLEECEKEANSEKKVGDLEYSCEDEWERWQRGMECSVARDDRRGNPRTSLDF